MKREPYTDEQIRFALKQVESGTEVGLKNRTVVIGAILPLCRGPQTMQKRGLF
jgi:hypothetical protein